MIFQREKNKHRSHNSFYQNRPTKSSINTKFEKKNETFNKSVSFDLVQFFISYD